MKNTVVGRWSLVVGLVVFTSATVLSADLIFPHSPTR